MKRNANMARILGRREPWDMVVIGAGATGVGIAVDAAARGYAVCLLEQSDFGKGTSSRSREHVLHVGRSGLLTIAGGKWTTYRKMAEDVVDHAVTLGRLEERPCRTRDLRIHGYHERATEEGDLWFYGSAAGEVRGLIEATPALGRRLHEALPIVGAQVVYAARFEMARTVEDVLARRTRALFLDARAAVAMAAETARLLAGELGKDAAWERAQVASFEAVTRGYMASA
jgi:glycerol-3-phosphate dehydrogenase